MKPNTFLITCLCFISLTCLLSCKKDSSSLNITYTLTWTSTLTQGSTLAVGYINTTSDQMQMDYNLSGSGWNQSITLPQPANPLILSVTATLNVQQPGTIEGKIYVNGQLKADRTEAFLSAGAVGYNCNFGLTWTYSN